jgi:hypothetical protein
MRVNHHIKSLFQLTTHSLNNILSMRRGAKVWVKLKY